MIASDLLVVQSYRDIAKVAGAALGATPGVLADLQAQGYLVGAGKPRRLVVARRLLDEWAIA